MESFDCKKLLDIPIFEYKSDNARIIKQWRKLLGSTKPKHDYNPNDKVSLEVIRKYRDMQLNRVLDVGERIMVSKCRAESIQSAGYGRIINGEV
jgi:hypothetical protein